MALKAKEVEALRTKYKEIEGAELITCVPVMIQVKITRTMRKTLTACFQFPDNYPAEPILLELKSKYLAQKLCEGLEKVCEAEARKILGQPQILPLCHFIRKFIDENPLCVCSEEIATIKSKLMRESDEIRLKQKTSQIILKLREDNYYITAKITVPENYPEELTDVLITDHNFPTLLAVNCGGQTVEIARRCVQPPLKKNPKDPPFVPKPSLLPIAEYIMNDFIRKHPNQNCPVCGKQSLPSDPKEVITDPYHDAFVERVYCGHLYHHGCLDNYMKTPPFTGSITGGKECPTCGKRIYHERWKAPPSLVEARWALQEARKRELEDVQDFFL